MTDDVDPKFLERGHWARIEGVLFRARGMTFETLRVYPQNAAQFALALDREVITVGSVDDPPRWVLLSADQVEAWFNNHLNGRWRGQPVQVTGPADEFTGMVEIYYEADPALAAEQRWFGDRYDGWRGRVPYAEITDLELQVTDRLAVRDRLRRKESEQSAAAAAAAPAPVRRPRLWRRRRDPTG